MMLNHQKSTANMTVETLIGAIQSGDKATINEYLENVENTSSNENSIISEDSDDDESNSAIVNYENSPNETNENSENMFLAGNTENTTNTNTENTTNTNTETKNNTVKKSTTNESKLENDDETIRMFSKKMSYNIVDTKADFKNATVTVEITNKNIGQVITAALFKTLQDAFSSKDTNQDSINSYIKDLIDSDSIESKTTTITFNLVKRKR